MPMGATWLIHVGDVQRTLPTVLRDKITKAPIDLTGATSVLTTVTRRGDRAALQTTPATVTDAAGGGVSWTTSADVSTLPYYAIVEFTVTRPSGEVETYEATLGVVGRRSAAAPTSSPVGGGGGADTFVIQVARWSPAGDSVTEVQELDSALVPTGQSAYLWDDPTDATDALVAWPGDPNTLLDVKP